MHKCFSENANSTSAHRMPILIELNTIHSATWRIFFQNIAIQIIQPDLLLFCTALYFICEIQLRISSANDTYGILIITFMSVHNQTNRFARNTETNRHFRTKTFEAGEGSEFIQYETITLMAAVEADILSQ